jgi:hypothetical protein
LNNLRLQSAFPCQQEATLMHLERTTRRLCC